MLLTLESNLSVERSGTGQETTGELLFRKNKFSLFMDVANVDVLLKKVIIRFQVRRISDNEVIEIVGDPIPIQELGRWSGVYTNQAAIDQSDADITAKKAERDAKKAELQIKNNEVEIAKDEFAIANTLWQDLKAEQSILEALQNPTQDDLDRLVELETEIPLAKTDRDAKQDIRDTKTNERQILKNELNTLRDELQSLQDNAPVPIQELVDLYDDIIGTEIINNELTASGLVWVKTLPFLGQTIGDFIE